MRVLTSLLVVLLLVAPARADEPQDLVDRARLSVESVLRDPNLAGARSRLRSARGILIVPQMIKAGFFIGGEGGSGVLLSRDAQGRWSSPSFVTVAGASFGLQIGVEAKEVLFIVMTDKGMNSLLSPQAKLGADASVSVGTVGVGVEAATTGSPATDIIAFSKSQGLFGGAALEGSVIQPKADFNQAYYGQPVTPKQILVDRSVNHAGADGLRNALAAR
ncbi:MAG: lipid-binding SYLF domain-containing protein [Alphaproteobacteria bacterium]|nr:lipid-binding SYLF domain-containing protein [Alphaproteobacteria bacterium]